MCDYCCRQITALCFTAMLIFKIHQIFSASAIMAVVDSWGVFHSMSTIANLVPSTFLVPWRHHRTVQFHCVSLHVVFVMAALSACFPIAADVFDGLLLGILCLAIPLLINIARRRIACENIITAQSIRSVIYNPCHNLGAEPRAQNP